MEELLNKLLEADVLSEETKKELKEAFETQVKGAVDTAKKETEEQVRAELTEQWVKEREALIEAIDAKVSEYLETELSALKEDIDRFRDLEAEHAERLTETKKEMADELKSDLQELIEKLDAFLEIRLTAELDELREDLAEEKKKQFGRKIVEAFGEEFKSMFLDEDSAEAELAETRARLEDAEEALEEATRAKDKLERKMKLEEVLSPLEGRARDVMEAILKNVSTDMLEEGYKTFIGRVLKESDDTAEKEGKVLAEGAEEKKTAKKEEPKETEVVTGDILEETVEDADKEEKHLSPETRAKLAKLAGIKK